MRAPLLIAATLALAACGNNDQADNTQNVDENLTAENIVSNDVTAIDAVTGDAANMAADVDMNFGTSTRTASTIANEVDAAASRARPRRREPRAAGQRASRQHRREPAPPTPNNPRAARRPCAPAGSGATSAAPSPA